MKIKQFMHQGVECAKPETPLSAVAKTMREKDIGAMPVCANGKLIGIITDRDLALRAFANGKDLTKLTARDVMTTDVSCCHDAEDADDAVRVMESRRVRRLPVLNAKDELVGMVSLGDISAAMPRDISAEVLQSVAAHHT